MFVTGGLTAVIWTDFIQVIIMLIGALYLMIVSEFTEFTEFIASSLESAFTISLSLLHKTVFLLLIASMIVNSQQS